MGLGKQTTTIIPAHGKLSSSKKELQEYKENAIKWTNRIKELHSQKKAASEIVKDKIIKELAIYFSGTDKVWEQTIKKTIAVDGVKGITVSQSDLKTYEGTYQHSDGNLDEVIFYKKNCFFEEKVLLFMNLFQFLLLNFI